MPDRNPPSRSARPRECRPACRHLGVGQARHALTDTGERAELGRGLLRSVNVGGIHTFEYKGRPCQTGDLAPNARKEGVASIS